MEPKCRLANEVVDACPHWSSIVWVALEGKSDSIIGPDVPLGNSFDFAWFTVRANGLWSITIELQTVVCGEDYWAVYGRIPEREYSGDTPIRPLFINKPHGIRVRAKRHSQDGDITIVCRAADVLEESIKPIEVGFINCTL